MLKKIILIKSIKFNNIIKLQRIFKNLKIFMEVNRCQNLEFKDLKFILHYLFLTI